MLAKFMASASALAFVVGIAHAQTPGGNETAVTPECTPQPTCSVAAAPVSSSDRVIYEAAYFAQYNPQNAMDMVRQTPGFSLNSGDDDRRGFSGAVGNLLIDGVRPSTKSQPLDAILSRIPVGQVVRLEVLRGGAVAGDASGQSILLNVVRTPSAGSGIWEAGFEVTSRDVFAPRGELSYSGRNGQLEWGVGGSIFSQYRDLPGWRRVTDINGDLVANVDTPSPRDFREAAINGNVAFPLAGGRLAVNGEVRWFRFHVDNGLFATDPIGAPLSSFTNVFEEARPRYELGANYDREFGPWSLELIGLLNRANYESEEIGENIDHVGADDYVYLQDVKQDTGESILRATLSRALTPQHRIEIGGEGAFNSLDQQLIFLRNGVDPGIPNANVLIEEERAEFFGSHSWRPAENWTIDSRLTWETSTLTFTGDDNQTVELAFWKPSVQVSRTLPGNNQVRARVYRDVGQLDFGDFVSNAAVADSLIAGGNTDLTPQSSWIAEVGGDFRFPGGAALSLTLSHHQITDAQDLVTLLDTRGTVDPLDDQLFDAPGNLGDAEMTRLDANFSSPTPFIPGGRLTVSGYLRETEVTDPLTGRPRILSETPESQVNISFRQDIPSWRFAWGVEANKQGEFQVYRFNEVDTNEEGPWIDVFVETTALPNNMRLRAWAANAFDGTINRERIFYGDLTDLDPTNDGRTGPFRGRDLRERQFARAPWFIVELSGRF